MRKSFILLTMLCLAVISLQAQRGGGQRGGGERMAPEAMAKQRAENLQEKLGLSDEQYTKTYEVLLKNQKAIRAKMENFMANRDRAGMRTAMQASRKKVDKELKVIFSEKQWTTYLEWKAENAGSQRRGGGGR